jgi:hypothetical protein
VVWDLTREKKAAAPIRAMVKVFILSVVVGDNSEVRADKSSVSLDGYVLDVSK